jgi:hypothetical protein
MIDTINLYADFVMSNVWNYYLTKIRELSPKLADVINRYGIGTKVNLNGYDFESGQLLDDIPKVYQEEIYQSSVYDLLCELANKYGEFCKQ